MGPALTIGLAGAALYAAFATWLVACDRRPPHGGSWINLQGLASYLVTLPIAWLAERLGHKLDHRRNAHMLVAILGTAACVAAGVALLVWPFTL